MNAAVILISLAMAAIPLKSGNENSFRNNEEQVYVVHYKWGVLNADVARAHVSTSVTTHEGKPAIKAKMYGHTEKFCEMFVKVRLNFESLYMRGNHRAVKASRTANESKYSCSNEYTYLWDKGYIDAKLSSSNGKLKDCHIPLNESVMDVPTLFTSFRDIDLAKVSDGKPFRVKVAVDNDCTDLVFKYMGKEELNRRGVPKKAYNKFSVNVTAGEVFDTENAIKIWCTAEDGVVIPVYFELPLKLGRVVGRLESNTR